MTDAEKNSCEFIRQELKIRGLISLEEFEVLCEKHGVDPKLVKIYNMAQTLTK
jgi:hypothetical protein